MPENTLLVKKKMDLVANYSPQGDKVIIIVPKSYHEAIKKLKNPLHIIVEEILE